MRPTLPAPLMRRWAAGRARRYQPDAADFGTEFGMEIYLSQRSQADRLAAPAPARWWRRLARHMRLG